MIFKKLRGFTLIETVVTLAIVCLLVLMPTLYVKNIKEQVVLDNSTRQVKSTIDKYLHLATVKKKSYFLSYFDNNSSIHIKEPHKVSQVYLDKHMGFTILIIFTLAIVEQFHHGRLSLRMVRKKRK